MFNTFPDETRKTIGKHQVWFLVDFRSVADMGMAVYVIHRPLIGGYAKLT